MEMQNKKGIEKRNKIGQEEIAGFAIIMVIVAIILLAFLGSSLKKSTKEPIEQHEVNNFLQSVIQQTTKCKMNGEYIDVQDLIFECEIESQCENGGMACEKLEFLLRELVEGSWRVGEGQLYSGYNMSIYINGKLGKLGTIAAGRTAENQKGSIQEFPKLGDEVAIQFIVYY
jgi:hypothetical protein